MESIGSSLSTTTILVRLAYLLQHGYKVLVAKCLGLTLAVVQLLHLHRIRVRSVHSRQHGGLKRFFAVLSVLNLQLDDVQDVLYDHLLLEDLCPAHNLVLEVLNQACDVDAVVLQVVVLGRASVVLAIGPVIPESQLVNRLDFRFFWHFVKLASMDKILMVFLIYNVVVLIRSILVYCQSRLLPNGSTGMWL